MGDHRRVRRVLVGGGGDGLENITLRKQFSFHTLLFRSIIEKEKKRLRYD